MLDAEYYLFDVWGYPLSFLEIAATVTGLLSVWYASRANVLTWPIGIANEFFFFVLFFQVHLYSDMILQVFFFIVSVMGWANWYSKTKKSVVVSKLNRVTLGYALVILIVGTLGLGRFMSQIHQFLPQWFSVAAASPYADAFTTVASIMAIILQARKKIDSWYFWIAVDVVAIILYIDRSIYLIALEFFIFLIMCIYGYNFWVKQRNEAIA